MCGITVKEVPAAATLTNFRYIGLRPVICRVLEGPGAGFDWPWRNRAIYVASMAAIEKLKREQGRAQCGDDVRHGTQFGSTQPLFRRRVSFADGVKDYQGPG
jgi:hypothetical protein